MRTRLHACASTHTHMHIHKARFPLPWKKEEAVLQSSSYAASITELSPDYCVMNNRLQSMPLLDAYIGLNRIHNVKKKKKGNLTRLSWMIPGVQELTTTCVEQGQQNGVTQVMRSWANTVKKKEKWAQLAVLTLWMESVAWVKSPLTPYAWTP